MTCGVQFRCDLHGLVASTNHIQIRMLGKLFPTLLDRFASLAQSISTQRGIVIHCQQDNRCLGNTALNNYRDGMLTCATECTSWDAE